MVPKYSELIDNTVSKNKKEYYLPLFFQKFFFLLLVINREYN